MIQLLKRYVLVNHETNAGSDENRFINERLTDLYTISKGFGYELYVECKHHYKNGGNNLTMSTDEILKYIIDPTICFSSERY